MMRPSVRAISMLAVTFVVLMLTGGQAIAGQGTGNQITFCHATSAASNPYVVITTNPAAIIRKGHGDYTGHVFDPALGQHQPKWGDVIPAFDYPAFGRTPAGHFRGLNLSAGSPWLDRSCTSPPVSRLTLLKAVVNTGGGTASPSAWTLKAVGSTTLSGASGVSGSLAAGSYTLSEVGGPSGYAASVWSCPGKVVTASVVTLAAGDSVTCTITNTFQIPNPPQPAQLTLVKTVINGYGGTATPSDWTLSAAGPVEITGASGSPAVTRAAVSAGDFVLSEAAGPTGYTPSAWDCVGGTLDGSTLTIAVAQSTTCTITNTEDAPESQNPEETGDDEPVEVLGTGAAVTPTVPTVVASAGSPALAFTGADGIVPMGIFGLIALVLGAGLAAAAHRAMRE